MGIVDSVDSFVDLDSLEVADLALEASEYDVKWLWASWCWCGYAESPFTNRLSVLKDIALAIIAADALLARIRESRLLEVHRRYRWFLTACLLLGMFRIARLSTKLVGLLLARAMVMHRFLGAMHLRNYAEELLAVLNWVDAGCYRLDRFAGVSIGHLVRVWVVRSTGIGLMGWIGLGDGC